MEHETSYKETKHIFSQKLKLEYEIDDIIIVETPYVDKIFLCILRVSSEVKLKELWSLLNSVISSELSEIFQNDFQMWNFYLFYLCEDEVNIELKYEIVNDKFSSRKVVLDKFTENLDTQVVKKIISEYIIGNDILLDERSEGVPDLSIYHSESKVFKNLESIYLKDNGESDDKELLEKTLSKIISEIKDEN